MLSALSIFTVKAVSHRRRIARRARRGLGLLDTIIALAIIIYGLQLYFDHQDERQFKAIAAQEAAYLAQLKDHLEDFVGRNALTLMSSLSAGNARQITQADLNADDINVDLSSMEGIDGRSLDMWVIVEPLNRLAYIARASGTIDRLHFPLTSPEFGLMGSYIDDDPTSIRGIGLNWSVGNPSASGTVANQIGIRHGDAFAVGFVDLDADIRPYLHRSGERTPTGENLSTMAAPLELGGNAITGVTSLTMTGDLSVSGNISGTSASLTGVLQAGSVDVENSLDVTGAVAIGNLTTSGDVTAASVQSSGTISAASLAVAGSATLGSIDIGQNLEVSGALTATNGSLSNVEVGETLTARTVRSDAVTATSASINSLSATQGSLNQLTVGSCTGC
jgi:cytoskeletal protein CcmA (bactofilin family)